MVSPTGSGSGAGGTGSLGAPAVPTQREIETTAWTEINKAALAIVQDSVELSFSQIDKRYSTSHLGTQTGYRASEDQPLLDHTLANVRALLTTNVPVDSAWNSTYEDLVNQLQPDLRAVYQSEQEKPLNERNPSFAATANVLMLTAQILTKIAVHSQAPDPESFEAVHTDNNLIASLVANKQSVINILQAAGKAEEFLEEEGANLPNHDEYKNAITQLKGVAEILNKMDLGNLMDAKEKGVS